MNKTIATLLFEGASRKELLAHGLVAYCSDPTMNGLLLIPAHRLHEVPDGVELTDILGHKTVLRRDNGKPNIDLDTRHGILAYGVIRGE